MGWVIFLCFVATIVFLLLGIVVDIAAAVERRRLREAAIRRANERELSYPRPMQTQRTPVAVSSAPAPQRRPPIRLTVETPEPPEMTTTKATPDFTSGYAVFGQQAIFTPTDTSISISFDGNRGNIGFTFSVPIHFNHGPNNSYLAWSQAVYDFVRNESTINGPHGGRDYYAKLFLLLAGMSGAKISQDVLIANGLSPHYFNAGSAENLDSPLLPEPRDETERRMRL